MKAKEDRKTEQIGIRVDAATYLELKKYEKETTIAPVALGRMLLGLFLEAKDKAGRTILPPFKIVEDRGRAFEG